MCDRDRVGAGTVARPGPRTVGAGSPAACSGYQHCGKPCLRCSAPILGARQTLLEGGMHSGRAGNRSASPRMPPAYCRRIGVLWTWLFRINASSGYLRSRRPSCITAH